MASVQTNRRLGVFLQYTQMAINIIINLLFTPIMIKIIGKNEYGIYSTVASIISYLSIFSLGFNATYIKFYSKYKKNNDDDAIKRLNTLYLSVFCVMGAVALICGTILSNNASILFNETYSSADLELAKKLMILLTINMTISFPASLFTAYISSQERFIFQKLVTTGKTIISPLMNIILLYGGYGSIGVVFTTTMVSILVDIVNITFCFSKLKMRFKLGKVESGLAKELFVFTFFIAINQIIDQLNWQTDKIILGKLINSAAAAVYSVSATINALYIQFSVAVSSVYTPAVHKLCTSEDTPENINNQLTNMFINIGRIQYFILMLILTGFIFFGQYFLKVWVGFEFSANELKIMYIATILLISSTTIPLIQNLGIEIQRAKNQHRFRSVVYLIIAISNVLFSIWFCYMWGIIGVTVATLITNILGTLIIMNIYYHKKTGINIPKFWKEIFSASVGMLPALIVGTLFFIFIDITSVWLFFTLILAYTITYTLSIYFFSLNDKEKGFVNKVVRKFVKAKKKA